MKKEAVGVVTGILLSVIVIDMNTSFKYIFTLEYMYMFTLKN